MNIVIGIICAIIVVGLTYAYGKSRYEQGFTDGFADGLKVAKNILDQYVEKANKEKDDAGKR